MEVSHSKGLKVKPPREIISLLEAFSFWEMIRHVWRNWSEGLLKM
jgi:hypothetical protein